MGKQAAKNGRLALYGSIISAGAKAGTMAASGGTSGLALM